MSEPAATLPVPLPGRPGSDLDRLKRLALAGISSDHSRRAYRQALEDFLSWYGAGPRGPLSKVVVLEYRAALEARESVRKSGVAKAA
jgi:hypothetical protein